MSKIAWFGLTYLVTYAAIVTIVMVLFDVAHDQGMVPVPIDEAVASPKFVPWLVTAAAANLLVAQAVMWILQDLIGRD
jgi:hypothetical protein